MQSRQCKRVLMLLAVLAFPLLFLSFAVQGAERARVSFGIGQSRQKTRDPGKHARDIEVFNRKAKAFNNLEVVFDRRGDLEEVVAHYERAIRIRPGYDAARKSLERARAKQEVSN